MKHIDLEHAVHQAHYMEDFNPIDVACQNGNTKYSFQITGHSENNFKVGIHLFFVPIAVSITQLSVFEHDETGNNESSAQFQKLKLNEN